MSAKELLSTGNQLTKFVTDKILDVEKYCNLILKKEKEKRGVDFLQYIGDKYKKKQIYPYRGFAGLSGGSYYQAMLGKNKKIKGFCFYAIPEFYKFCNELSRNAENLLRQKMNIPKVGERWISETEFYYEIKKYLKDYKVVHHYNAQWLGRQHLDIFIPALKIAFEYQGQQHFEPLDCFGGQETFLEMQKLDRRKKAKCTRRNIKLYYVKDGYILEDILKIIAQSSKKQNIA